MKNTEYLLLLLILSVRLDGLEKHAATAKSCRVALMEHAEMSLNVYAFPAGLASYVKEV